MAVKRDEIASAIEVLNGLPQKEPDEFSRRAAIEKMFPDIQAALARGYSLLEIFERLQKVVPDFANMKFSSFRTFVSEHGKSTKPAVKKGSRRILRGVDPRSDEVGHKDSGKSIDAASQGNPQKPSEILEGTLPGQLL